MTIQQNNMTDTEWLNVFMFIMDHKGVNAEYFFDEGNMRPSIFIAWNDDDFKHGTGPLLTKYDEIMDILQAMVNRDKARREFNTALRKHGVFAI